MKHDFTKYINRKDSDSYKWDSEYPNVTYPLGCADSDFESPKEIFDAMNKRLENHVFGYNGYRVIAGAQAAIKGYYKRRHEMDVELEHIVTTTGLMFALNLMIRTYSNEGDLVIIQTPVYHNFKKTVEQVGRSVSDNKLVYNRENGTYSVDFDDLEARASEPRAKILLICNPMNPVGRTFTKDELLRIHEICTKHDVIVLSDEVHCDLAYEDNHICYHSICEEAKNNAIVMNASGKSFNTSSLYGSMLIIPNRKLRTEFELALAATHIDVNEFAIIANTVSYSQCDYYIDGLKEYLLLNKAYIEDFFAQQLPSVRVIKQNATYLAWLDFADWGMTNNELHAFLISNGIGLGNGAVFGASEGTFMRLNYACHSKTLSAALAHLKQVYTDKIAN